LKHKYSVVQTPKFERNFRKLRTELQRRISDQTINHLAESLCTDN
jgi:mRNA-degrading endonuclease RelE of RelBE toxin-antitoxin system